MPAGGATENDLHIDLVGLDDAAARKELLDGLSAVRAKPTHPPAFPGRTGANQVAINQPPFPGNIEGAGRGRPGSGAGGRPYIPTIRGAISDLDRTRFIRQAFETVRDHFERGLQELTHQPAVDIDFTRVTDTEFTAQVFVRGMSAARCRVWLDGGFGSGNQISYYEGHFERGNVLNEALRIGDNPHELVLSALMNMTFGPARAAEGLNPSRMTPEEGAEYLWRRFMSAVE